VSDDLDVIRARIDLARKRAQMWHAWTVRDALGEVFGLLLDQAIAHAELRDRVDVLSRQVGELAADIDRDRPRL